MKALKILGSVALCAALVFTVCSCKKTSKAVPEAMYHAENEYMETAIAEA